MNVLANGSSAHQKKWERRVISLSLPETYERHIDLRRYLSETSARHFKVLSNLLTILVIYFYEKVLSCL